jgi:hypothetical protein
MPGKTGYPIWYERTEDELNDYNNADSPSNEREKIRITFL